MAIEVERSRQDFWYVLRADRDLPAEQQTRFRCNHLTALERMRVYDRASWITTDKDGGQTLNSRSFEQAMDLVISHVQAIENFPVGAPAEWPEGRAERLRYLERMADLDVFEVGNAIRDQSSLGATEKNS